VGKYVCQLVAYTLCGPRGSTKYTGNSSIMWLTGINTMCSRAKWIFEYDSINKRMSIKLGLQI
jgi:hypothetical protein